MTVIKVHHNGAWVNVPATNLKVQWGNVWRDASAIKVQWGNSWVATDYRGYPATPQTPWLAGNTWDPEIRGEDKNNTLTIRWGRRDQALQADIVQYDIRLRGEFGFLIVQHRRAEMVPGPQEWTFANLKWDTRYRMDVRAVALGGWEGDWSDELRIDTGHPVQRETKVVTKSRAWDKTVQVDMYRDQIAGPIVPTDVTANKIKYDLRATFPTNVLSDPGSNRTIHRVVQGDPVGAAFEWREPISVVYDIVNQNGEGKRFGGICRGTGWSVEGQSNAARAVGTITVYGTETYRDTVTETTPAREPFQWRP